MKRKTGQEVRFSSSEGGKSKYFLRLEEKEIMIEDFGIEAAKQRKEHNILHDIEVKIELARPDKEEEKKEQTVLTSEALADNGDPDYYYQAFRNTKSFKYIFDQEKNQKSFPVLLLCHDRVNELEKTLDSLLAANQVNKNNILAVQDGFFRDVSNYLLKNGIKLVRHKSLKTNQEGRKIAAHYKFSINEAFKHFPATPAIIIMEDDLVVSPDILEYFSVVAPVIENDETLFTASAWNDNGFGYAVKDEAALLRTTFFPGLGWLLLREEWENNLKGNWPVDHWDWFIREKGSMSIKENLIRETLHPEIPRVSHIGRKGSFMDERTQARYFDPIQKNLGNIKISKQEVFEASLENYDRKFKRRIEAGVHLTETAPSSRAELSNHKSLVVWYRAPQGKSQEKIQSLMEMFKLWHEPDRGQRYNVHEFWFENTHLIMINLWSAARARENIFAQVAAETWENLKPDSVKVFNTETLLARIRVLFSKQKQHNEVLDITAPLIKIFVADREGQSCDDVCSQTSMSCELSGFDIVNTCENMRKHHSCQTCKASFGLDQPAYFMSSDQITCFYNTKPDYISCSGYHKNTKRLCPCVNGI
eukprot:snap_masked-scaffold_1-processed-gene-9.46-mRNA-1 protein AED:0.55 eAED:0.55 QI:0/-1/0/1/-1/1/1/0/589